MTWSIQCSDQQASKGTGEMVLNGDSYDGTMKITGADSRRGEMQMTQHIKGKRLGDCK